MLENFWLSLVSCSLFDLSLIPWKDFKSFSLILFNSELLVLPSLLLMELLLDNALPLKGILVLAGFFGGILLLDCIDLPFRLEVGIREGLDALGV